MTDHGFVAEGPRLKVINPAIYSTYCSGCGASFVKGSYVRRSAGGYGYLCEQCHAGA